MLYNWQRFAACKGLPTEWFFGHENDQTYKIPEEAKRACRSCPVVASCKEHAIKYERYGFWALTTKGQRIRLRKKLGIEIQSVEGIACYHEGEYLLPPVR